MRQRLCSVTWTLENAHICAWSVREHQGLFTICAKNPIGNEIAPKISEILGTSKGTPLIQFGTKFRRIS